MKTNNAECIPFTEKQIEYLQYMQDKETVDRLMKNSMSLNSFIVRQLDFDNTEEEFRKYIIWLHFLDDIMELLQFLESFGKERRAAV